MMRRLNSVVLAIAGVTLSVGVQAQTAGAPEPRARVSSATPPGGRGAKDDPKTVEARKHYEAGLAAAKLGRWQDAYRAHLSAWRLKRHWQVAGNLGQAELELGMYPDAAEHLAIFLREAKGVGPEERAQVRGWLERAKSKSFVGLGAHGIESRKEGLPAARKTVDAPGGSSRIVRLDRKAALVPKRRVQPAIVISGSVLTAVAIGTGIGLVAVANGKKDDTDATRATLASAGGCSAPSLSWPCKDLRSALGRASTMHNVAVGAFFAAGIVGVATATYAVIASRPRAKERGVGYVQIAPMFGSAGGGFLIGGTF